MTFVTGIADNVVQRFGHTRSGMLLIALAALLWGTAGVTGHLLGEQHTFSPLAVSFYRLFIGGATLLLLQRGRIQAAPTGWHAVGLVFVGLGMALYQASFFFAVSLAGVSLSTLVALGLAPVLVAAASVLLFKQRPEGRLLLSLAAALVGLVLLVGSPTTATAGTTPGAALSVLAAAGFAAVTLLGRWLSAQVAPTQTTIWGFGIGAATLLPLVLASGLSVPDGPVAALLLLYLGVGPTALAYYAFFQGVRWVLPSQSSILALLEPLTATVISALLFDERLSPLGLGGAALLLLAVAMLYVASRPTPAQGCRGSVASRSWS